MARSAIPVVEVVRGGISSGSQTTADATNKHYVDDNDGRVMLEIVSTDAGAQSVVIQPSPTLTADGLTVNGETIAVAAGATVYAGPFRSATFNQDTTNRRLYVDPSVDTTLKFRAIKLPTP